MSCLAPKNKTKDLTATISKHLTAIENRNLENLINTVNRDEVILILPSGKYSNSFEEYKIVNKKWFEDETWEIDYQIVEKNIVEDIGIVLTKITYQNVTENKKNNVFSYYLTLVFEWKNYGWKLIFDQNTLIK